MKFYQIVNLILFFSLSISCTKSKTNAVRSENPPWIRWAIAENMVVLEKDPCSTLRCQQIASLTMDGLVEIYWENGLKKVRPQLAEKWTFLSPTKLQFTIKEKIRWSNGAPLVAEDFIHGWKRTLSGKDLRKASFFFPIRNAKKFFEKKVPFSDVGIRKLDPRTIEMELLYPQPNFLASFAHPALWPHPPSGSTRVVIGPFIPEKSSADTLKLRANPRYHAGPSHLSGIEIKSIPNKHVRLQLLEQAEIDFIDDIPPDVLQLTAPKSVVLSAPARTGYLLSFNLWKKPFHLKKVRQAFSTALSRNEYPSLTKSLFVAALQLNPLNSDIGISADGYSVERAQKLLNELRDSGESIRFTVRPIILYPSGNLVAKELVESLQAQWIKTLGVHVEPISFTDQPSETSSQLAAMAILPFQSDALARFENLETLGTQSSRGNPFRWRNKAFDLLLNTAALSNDFATYQGNLQKVEQYLVNEEAVVFPLLSTRRIALQRPELQGVKATPLEFWDFRHVFLN